MHACGHDIHTSVMLGAALLLKEREAELPGRVRILFQPAEETTGGAKDCNFHPKLLIMVNLVFRYSVAWTLIHKMNNYNDYG